MVFKGFTDENGNVIPVQGAGTVYNEEKNSLALGKDTVATGQDQFVFGRGNEADATKAELVGGGVKIVIEGKVHISLYNDDKQRHARMVFSIPIDKGIYNFAADSDFPESILSYAQSEFSDGFLNNIARLESVEIEDGLENLYDFCYIGGPNDYLDSSDNHKIGDFWYFVYAEKNNPSNWAGDQFDPIRGYTLSYVSSEQKRNIRTLDWAGNEKLAGGLTVGTGITIGETSLSEAELIALKALLNS